VEEFDETPVDIPRRNSEDCPNEDRPTSGADEGWDGGAEGADGHTKRAILFLPTNSSRRRAPHLCRCAGLVVVVSVEAFLLILNINEFIRKFFLQWIV